MLGSWKYPQAQSPRSIMAPFPDDVFSTDEMIAQILNQDLTKEDDNEG